jgi:sodium/hydrogen exchanger-like protein 3
MNTFLVNASTDTVIDQQRRLQVVNWRWDEVRWPLTAALWLTLAVYCKAMFNNFPRLVGHIPDSSLLICAGLLIGAIFSTTPLDHSEYELASYTFFMFLLPPIVFDAGYFMPNRAFWNNLGTILVYAVFGTLFNVATIGCSLFSVSLTGCFTVPLTFLHVGLNCAQADMQFVVDNAIRFDYRRY